MIKTLIVTVIFFYNNSKKAVKLDAKRPPVGALPGASGHKRTLLVHPFSKNNESKCYLLETPKVLKRKTPLLEIPKDFTKKPRLFHEHQDISNNDLKKTFKKNNSSKVQSETSNNCQSRVGLERAESNTPLNKQSEVNNTHSEITISQSEVTASQSDAQTYQSQVNTSQSSVNTCQSKVNTSQSEIKSCHSGVKCHHCCCKGCHKEEVTDDCCSSVKVIFAPAMMPSIFGPMPGIPYIIKQPVKVNENVSRKFLV